LCVFNKIHSLRTHSNISDHLSKVVSDLVFHSSTLVLPTFARWINSSKSPSSSKVFVIFLSTSAISFVLCSICSQVRGFLSSVQWNIPNARNNVTPFF
jgi:hypothetical protein